MIALILNVYNILTQVAIVVVVVVRFSASRRHEILQLDKLIRRSHNPEDDS